VSIIKKEKKTDDFGVEELVLNELKTIPEKKVKQIVDSVDRTARNFLDPIKLTRLTTGGLSNRQTPYLKISEEYKKCLQYNTQFPYCPIPFRLDPYLGCTHNCTYCFANDWLKKLLAPFGSYTMKDVKVRPADIGVLKKYFHTAEETDRKGNKEVQCIRREFPIHMGGMSDPFQPIEDHYRRSLEALEFMKERDYPVVISTKGNLMLKNPWKKVIQDYKSCVIQVSLISDDDNLISRVDPNAPNATKRLEMMKELKDMGKKVICRVEPILPGRSHESLESLIRKLGKIGVDHASFAWVRLSTDEEWLDKMSCAMQQNIVQLYSYATEFRSKMRAASWFIYKESLKQRDWCHEEGLTFGAANGVGTLLGDTHCCCGVDLMGGKFKGNVSNYNYFWAARKLMNNWNAGLRSEKNLTFRFSDFDKYKVWRPEGNMPRGKRQTKIKGEKKGRCLNAKGVDEMFLGTWNKKTLSVSYPDSVKHIMFDKWDEDGNAIYKYVENDPRFSETTTLTTF